MEFQKVVLPDKRIFHGREFPGAVALKRTSESKQDVLKLLEEKAKDGYFNKLLEEHGALVIRNLGDSDPDTLTEFVKCIGLNSGDVFFEQNGTIATRTEINDVLSTANEGPPTKKLFQHNEFSRFHKYPKKLFFVCSEFDAEGGETPLVHGGEYFEEIYKKNPELVKKLGEKGLYLKQVWPKTTDNKTSWSDKFCFGRNLQGNDSFKEKKAKAEFIVKDAVSDDFEWDQDDNLIVHQHTIPIREYIHESGETYPCSFNSIATFYGDHKYAIDGHDKTDPIRFDDGEIIPPELLDSILQTSIDISYNFKWVKGDVVIVDNFQVSHGRLPWNGTRKVLVSMWDTPEMKPFEPWVPSK